MANTHASSSAMSMFELTSIPSMDVDDFGLHGRFWPWVAGGLSEVQRTIARLPVLDKRLHPMKREALNHALGAAPNVIKLPSIARQLLAFGEDRGLLGGSGLSGLACGSPQQ